MQFHKSKMNLSLTHKWCFSLLILIFLFLLTSSSVFSNNQYIPFEKFISQFTSEQQNKANNIWSKLDSSEQVAAPEEASIAEKGITDEQLFKVLSIKNKEEYLDELKNIRQQLSAAQKQDNDIRQTYLKWEQFINKVKDKPNLGIVYLKSLGIKQKYQSLLSDTEKQVASLEKQIQSIREDVSLSHVSLNFTFQDWIVIVVYLIFTTIIGGLLAGKQASMKDFFLGGRKLAWPAVCGSIIATELSAATFLIAPAIVFSKGGDMTYIQLAIGTIVARFIIGYFFIPAYYEREIYSPYDYMGNQLGPRVKISLQFFL